MVGWSVSGAVDPDDANVSLAAARTRVETLMAAGAARGDAARQVSAETGIPRRSLYVP